jgi:hypothetical protein
MNYWVGVLHLFLLEADGQIGVQQRQLAKAHIHNVEHCAADKLILSTDNRKFMLHFTKTTFCPGLESSNAMCSSLDQRVRQDLLWRLRWNLVDAAEDIEIATGPHDRIINMPLISHPLANEFLFDPPLNCIDQIDIRDFKDQVDRTSTTQKRSATSHPLPSESKMRMEFRSPCANSLRNPIRTQGATLKDLEKSRLYCMESQSRMRMAPREELSPRGILSDYLVTLGYI